MYFIALNHPQMFPVMHLFVKSTTKPTNKAIAWNFLETSTANN